MILDLAKLAASLLLFWFMWRCVEAIDRDEAEGKFELIGGRSKRLRDNLP